MIRVAIIALFLSMASPSQASLYKTYQEVALGVAIGNHVSDYYDEHCFFEYYRVQNHYVNETTNRCINKI